MSLREIAEKTHIPKTTILKTFQKDNVPRRAMKICQAPYGHAYLEGIIVVDPKEYSIARKILGYHHKGYAMRAIARELNGITVLLNPSLNTIKKKVQSHHPIF